jgi:hypothetical protein
MSILNSPKVFGIGFHKTGTTSLNSALTRLGYTLTGPNGVEDPDIKKNVYKMCYEIAERYDAFLDNPWPIVYKEMDNKYPESKFILTLRPVDEWYESIAQHFKDTNTPMREWIYGAGSPVGNKKLYKDRYLRHYDEVREYFINREGSLLEFDLVGGDGWGKLCTFLSKGPITDDIPHLNKGSYKK